MSYFLVTEVSWSAHKSRVERVKWAPMLAGAEAPPVLSGEPAEAEVGVVTQALSQGDEVFAGRYVDGQALAPVRLRRIVDRQGHATIESMEAAHPLTDLPEF